MLIVCPNCATSYMIDPASVGPAGRAVRCARCKSTWFAANAATTGKAAPGISAFVDGAIAEAEAAESGNAAAPSSAAADNGNPPPSTMEHQPGADDFGGEGQDNFPPQTDADFAAVPFDAASENSDLAPRADGPHETFDGEHAGLAVTDGPPLVPPLDHDRPDGLIGGNDVDESGSYIARRQRLKARRQQSKRTSRWTAIILVLFAFNVALIGARSEVVRYLPQTASLFAAVGLPVNLRNLKFDKVKIVKEAQDGVNILIVEGLIVNTANKPTEVPRLRFSARNATGQEVYTWTALPRRSLLPPGENVEFQSRLAAPPADATDVMVRFFTAQDAAVGAK